MVSAEAPRRGDENVLVTPQAGCLLLYTVCLSLWLYAEWLTYRRRCAHCLRRAFRLLSEGHVWRCGASS